MEVLTRNQWSGSNPIDYTGHIVTWNNQLLIVSLVISEGYAHWETWDSCDGVVLELNG